MINQYLPYLIKEWCCSVSHPELIFFLQNWQHFLQWIDNHWPLQYPSITFILKKDSNQNEIEISSSHVVIVDHWSEKRRLRSNEIIDTTSIGNESMTGRREWVGWEGGGKGLTVPPYKRDFWWLLYSFHTFQRREDPLESRMNPWERIVFSFAHKNEHNWVSPSNEVDIPIIEFSESSSGYHKWMGNIKKRVEILILMHIVTNLNRQYNFNTFLSHMSWMIFNEWNGKENSLFCIDLSIFYEDAMPIFSSDSHSLEEN